MYVYATIYSHFRKAMLWDFNHTDLLPRRLDTYSPTFQTVRLENKCLIHTELDLVRSLRFIYT